MELTRRNFLVSTATLSAGAGGLLPAALQSSAPGPSALASPPLKVIICGGHPGDPEYGCGGTVARLTALGHKVGLLYLNDGAWPPTHANVRLAEARRACDLLQARPLYAGQINGHASVDNEHFDQYRKVLEAEKPDAVFTHWPLDNHRDHRACWNLTYDSWRQLDRKFSLYYYEVSDGKDTLQFSPTHYVDITETEPLKRAACYAHASQSPDSFYLLQDQIATFRGIELGSKRAEAFVLQSRGSIDVLGAALQSRAGKDGKE